MAELKTILVVEDDGALREVVRFTLEKPDISILEAADGLSGLRLARETLPDLILLDWMMPGMDGIEVVENLRQDEATALIPIVMLTAVEDDENMRRGLEAGANAYLRKPFSPLELVKTVEEML
jgi:CheY-like chemotaxis protein